MKVILYMAISIDGFIAKKDGDSDWVSDEDSAIFEEKVKETSCIILGKRTFEQFRGELYPFKGATNIVITSDTSRTKEIEETVFASSPQEALKVAKDKGHERVLLIGGGITNGIFLKENLIDEILLSVHPLVLGQGIKLFEVYENQLQLKLLGTKLLEKDLIQLHYKVVK